MSVLNQLYVMGQVYAHVESPRSVSCAFSSEHGCEEHRDVTEGRQNQENPVPQSALALSSLLCARRGLVLASFLSPPLP